MSEITTRTKTLYVGCTNLSAPNPTVTFYSDSAGTTVRAGDVQVGSDVDEKTFTWQRVAGQIGWEFDNSQEDQGIKLVPPANSTGVAIDVQSGSAASIQVKDTNDNRSGADEAWEYTLYFKNAAGTKTWDCDPQILNRNRP